MVCLWRQKNIWFLSVCASGGKKSMFDSFGSFFRVLNHRFPTFYYFFLRKHIFLRMLQLLLYKNVCFQWHSKYLAVFLEKRETFGAKPDFGRTSFSGSTASVSRQVGNMAALRNIKIHKSKSQEPSSGTTYCMVHTPNNILLKLQTDNFRVTLLFTDLIITPF